MTVTEIPVRRPAVDLGATELDRWPVEGDPILSHLLHSLSAAFPNGEDFFVHSVRNYRGALADRPELKQRVKGFIGQEAMHGREHRLINEHFATLGYPSERQDATVLRAARRLERLPKALQLATTAASEHFTAVLAVPVLTHEATRDALFAHPDIAVLIEWHAMEELEHKDVAFDVFEAVSGNYAVRILGLGTAALYFGLPITVDFVRAVVADRRHIGRRELRRFVRNYRTQRMLRLRTLREMARYLRPGFHPSDDATDHIVEEWRERLADAMRLPAAERAG